MPSASSRPATEAPGGRAVVHVRLVTFLNALSWNFPYPGDFCPRHVPALTTSSCLQLGLAGIILKPP